MGCGDTVFKSRHSDERKALENALEINVEEALMIHKVIDGENEILGAPQHRYIKYTQSRSQ